VPCRIILVRHGETEANRRSCFATSNEIPLTDPGRRQAEELAREIRSRFVPHTLYSSPFRRAVETAAIIGSHLGLGVNVLPGIHERDFGSLRGYPYARLSETMLSDSRYQPGREWLWKPDGGESLEDVRQRVVETLTSLYDACGEGDVVVVCHGAVMQGVRAHLTGDWAGASVPVNCGIEVIDRYSLSFGRQNRNR
jgi:2,3-bisphosphoglycerate-dependent phosphoglycerate mutase